MEKETISDQNTAKSHKASRSKNASKNKSKRQKRKLKRLQNKYTKKPLCLEKDKLLNFAISSWAENYTNAATWQLKQEIAYWKAEAKALHCENQLLHKIIREKCASNDTSTSNLNVASDNNSEPEDDNESVQVTDEYVNFLTENFKYKEEARLEKEKRRALEIRQDDKNDEPKVESLEERKLKVQNCYGSQWQKISALEMSLETSFMSNNDKYKPNYWPNIPLNIKFNS